MQGEVLLYYIENYVSDGRLVRIVGPDGKKYVPLTRQPGTTKYDVVIDEAPSSPNQKERTFEILMQLLPPMIKMGYIPPVEMLDYLPLPETLIEAMKEKQQEAQQQPSPEEQKAQAELKAKQMEMQMKGQEKQLELQFDSARGAQNLQLERAKAFQKMELEAMEAGQDMNITLNKTDLELAIKETLGRLAIQQKRAENSARERQSQRENRGD
jgi:hypothetical protein